MNCLQTTQHYLLIIINKKVSYKIFLLLFYSQSVSYFTNPNVSLKNPRNFKAVDKQKTLRHIKYLHIERTQNNSNLKRSRSCYTTNQSPIANTLNLTSESLSSKISPLHHDRNRINDHKSTSSLVITNYKEFSEIVRRYETNQYAVSKCKFLLFELNHIC